MKKLNLVICLCLFFMTVLPLNAEEVDTCKSTCQITKADIQKVITQKEKDLQTLNSNLQHYRQQALKTEQQILIIQGYLTALTDTINNSQIVKEEKPNARD
jgi:septal ring factor EnvC (AmiA/AmiB activator)